MGLSKAQWRDLVKDNLSGGSQSAELKDRWHNAIIEKYLDISFDTVLNRNKTGKENMFDEMGTDLWKYSALTKTFTLDILYDSTRKRHYSELPVNIVSITNNNGIMMVFPVEEEQSAFIPRGTNDLFLMGNLDVSTMGLRYFTLEGKRLYYSGAINNCWKQVLAKLVLSFSEFDDDDDIDIPNGLNAEMLQMVLALMKGKLPSDIVNDDAPIQVTQ